MRNIKILGCENPLLAGVALLCAIALPAASQTLGGAPVQTLFTDTSPISPSRC